MIKRGDSLQPDECQNMPDIRREIDFIDRQIIEALGKRYKYVKAAAKFKTSETEVRAPERFKTMLAQRRSWAIEHELSAEIVEKIFRDLVNYFINEEIKQWQNK